MVFDKRGQASGAGAATLVLVLTILIILYIVFLTPSEQAQVLGNEPVPGLPGPGPGTPGQILLSEHPGRLEYVASRELEHQIPTVNLYSTTAATELKAIRSLYVKHGWLDEVGTNFTFRIENLAQVDDVTLTFSRTEGQGRLMVWLNGALIFDDELTMYNVEPITLPKDLLRQENQVVFGVEGVGWKFWRTNEYRLQDIRVIADVTDISTTAAQAKFVVTESERDNMERAILRLYPDCVPGKVGILTILLNGHEVFSGVPDCGVVRAMEMSSAYFLAGENTISFHTAQGVYLIDQITLRTQLKQAVHPTYYFEVDDPTLARIASGANAVLYLDFVDDVTYKAAQVFVNGRAFSVTTRDNQWWTSISRHLQPGTNAVEIIPRSSLDVVNLEVVLE